MKQPQCIGDMDMVARENIQTYSLTVIFERRMLLLINQNQVFQHECNKIAKQMEEIKATFNRSCNCPCFNYDKRTIRSLMALITCHVAD